MTDDNVLQFPPPAAPDAPKVDGQSVKDAVEALLFASGEPVTLQELVAALDVEDAEAVRVALHAIAQEKMGRGVQLVRVAGAWQLRTDPRFADAVLRLRGGKPQRMSRSALETLSIVAYRQPVIRSEIDELRGVNSGGVLKSLLDRGYIRVVGRRDLPGRPLEYGTSRLFLEMFGLNHLADLPTLKERASLAVQQEPELELPRELLDDEHEASAESMTSPLDDPPKSE